MNKIMMIALALGLWSSSVFAAGMSDFAVCFSPAGHCDAKLQSFVASAKQTLDIAIYSLTLSDLAQTIAKANAAGIKVRVICDRSEAKTGTSQIANLVKAKVPVKIGNVQGIMHNKFTIVDGHMLETGSFNYSNNAANMNAENQIYLDNPDVVNAYRAQFELLWKNAIPPQ
jgi:phosphatidylserine/phosphatidylglycerophosphate/cardiolipin synthase-like enzyme